MKEQGSKTTRLMVGARNEKLRRITNRGADVKAPAAHDMWLRFSSAELDALMSGTTLEELFRPMVEAS